MPKLVVHGASLRCDKGTSPASLQVVPHGSSENETAYATVNDNVPVTNIPPFGNCTTQANPAVASATTAAQGVLTPMPCVPVTSAPWSPGASGVTIDGQTALTDDSSCKCNWTGKITITDAGAQAEVA